MKKVNARIRMLEKYGYRMDQLIFDERTQDFTCSLDDLPAAVALIRNEHGIDLNSPEILNSVRDFLRLGYLPHHLFVFADGEVLFDRDVADMDETLLAIGSHDDP